MHTYIKLQAAAKSTTVGLNFYAVHFRRKYYERGVRLFVQETAKKMDRQDKIMFRGGLGSYGQQAGGVRCLPYLEQFVPFPLPCMENINGPFQDFHRHPSDHDDVVAPRLQDFPFLSTLRRQLVTCITLYYSHQENVLGKKLLVFALNKINCV